MVDLLVVLLLAIIISSLLLIVSSLLLVLVVAIVVVFIGLVGRVSISLSGGLIFISSVVSGLINLYYFIDVPIVFINIERMR